MGWGRLWGAVSVHRTAFAANFYLEHTSSRLDVSITIGSQIVYTTTEMCKR